jgi:hypothetical protein
MFGRRRHERTGSDWNDGVVRNFLRASGYGPGWGKWTRGSALYAEYVEWAPVGVPVLSPQGFGRAMARVVSRKRVDGRSVYAVKRVGKPAALAR